MFRQCSLFVALLCIAVASSAHVSRRDAPADPTPSIEQVLQDTNAAFLKFFGFENKEQAQQKFEETGKKFVQSLDSYATQIKEQTENIKNTPLVKEINEQADKFAADLKSKNPQTSADLEKATQSFQALVTKVKDLEKTEEFGQLRKLGENLLTEVRSAATNVIDEASKSLKVENKH